jgi:hypothetical protein
VFFSSGCVDKTLYPAVLLTIVSVTPNEIKPASTIGSSAATIPTVSISLRSDTQVPAQLKGYSIRYTTNLGEDMAELMVPETPVDQYLTGGAENTIVITPYTQKVLDVYLSTVSDISPIRATISLIIHDVNKNTVIKEANCLLYRPAS